MKHEKKRNLQHEYNQICKQIDEYTETRSDVSGDPYFENLCEERRYLQELIREDLNKKLRGA
jgi:hypothetical protein